ncbi:hypothetical protein COV20_01430 [Candidatus Woesearchaeota archaeon CG10_big_fil_rev_8_21_14_0_10_45_16]|nr:MAG: hypothetical protein COV20_01430 [Candidatus Woesearchaeota archaeon CG10_big_fil_rev_8_21_14_0_10_45_16]
MELETVLVSLDFIFSFLAVVFICYALVRLRTVKHILLVLLSFLGVAVLLVTHVAIEFFELGEVIYALSALLATLLLGAVILLLRRESSIPMMKSRRVRR